MNKNIAFSKGVTLIELVISIIIVTISVGGITALFIQTTRTSADPMIRAQSLAIAQSYMDEIMMQPYTSIADFSISGITCSDGNPPDDTARTGYNDISDYNSLSDSGAHNQLGCLIDELNAYTVDIKVIPHSLNTLSAKQITVKVTHTGLGTSIPIIAYKTDY